MEKFPECGGRGLLHFEEDFFVTVICIGIEYSSVGVARREPDLPLLQSVCHACCEVVTPRMKHHETTFPIVLCGVELGLVIHRVFADPETKQGRAKAVDEPVRLYGTRRGSARPKDEGRWTNFMRIAPREFEKRTPDRRDDRYASFFVGFRPLQCVPFVPRMADVEAIIPNVANLQCEYFPRSKPCTHCKHVGEFRVLVGPGESKKLLDL